MAAVRVITGFEVHSEKCHI